MKCSATVVQLLAAVTTAHFAVATAEAGPIWQWAGPVAGHSFTSYCPPGADCGPSLAVVVPVGTPVHLTVSFNFDFGAPPLNPAVPCLKGTATTRLQVLGRTFSGTGYVWDEAHGFGPGTCQPGYDFIEIVTPSWGHGQPLADGWIAFSPNYLPGLWWAGDLMVQPKSLAQQFPAFYKPMQAQPQRFFANLQAVPDVQPSPVPEPATMTMVGVGLAFAARRRWRRQRGD